MVIDHLYASICKEASELADKQVPYSTLTMDEHQAQYEYNLFNLAYNKGREDEYQYQMDHSDD